jgi:hypothetical protein
MNIETGIADAFRLWQRRAAWIGALFLVAWLGIALVWHKAAFQGYWFAWVFWAGLGFGFIALCFLQFLTRGAWSLAVQRIAEAGATTLPLMALLLVPMLIGLRDVFPWVIPETLADAPHKRAYLTIPWFIARSFACLAVMMPLIIATRKWSAEEDRRTMSPVPATHLRKISAGGMLLYSVTMLVASTDWVMSLQPRWYSTMLVVILGISQLLSALAASIALIAFIAEAPALAPLLDTKCRRDLGNLLLAFVIFWTYVTFSQYLIIWSGNLPREIGWYLSRTTPGWKAVVTVLALLQFAVPFAVLLFRANKQSLTRLGMVAALVFAMGALHIYWLVAPAFGGPLSGPWWTALLAFLGMGGLWTSLFLWLLRGRPLVPLHAEEVLL